jgi:hypothetical protein
MRSTTLAELERWVEHGAGLRPLELGDGEAVIELCTCYGEPVDVVCGQGTEIIDFVRAHRSSISPA